MSFAGKALVKISFGPMQSYFKAENIQTMPNFELSYVLETVKQADVKNQGMWKCPIKFGITDSKWYVSL